MDEGAWRHSRSTREAPLETSMLIGGLCVEWLLRETRTTKFSDLVLNRIWIFEMNIWPSATQLTPSRPAPHYPTHRTPIRFASILAYRLPLIFGKNASCWRFDISHEFRWGRASLTSASLEGNLISSDKEIIVSLMHILGRNPGFCFRCPY